LEFVELKTGIPAGQVKDFEKQKLMNLEQLLHERVVGQDEAIVAISQAIRRSRSGLGKTNRPIGSFLFLGPTGVGKTETAKALGDIFFGANVPTVRFDMSEFSNQEALARLIGDSNTNTPGLLANAVREHAYGLLLLDEFEKASKDVHNLFLQILDEGFFSDVQGKKVNLRNMIIIATSNAGTDIDQLVAHGDFRPELINRFDGVIFFQPLGDINLNKVTRLMLKNLSSRLKEKGIELVITDDLISVLMEKGNDPHFGARPMNRAIADLVEEKIAEGLISGTIKSGSKVSFVKNEVGELILA
jgi:ATP-dependent Clp protease ATP-binding subunit ClpA